MANILLPNMPAYMWYRSQLCSDGICNSWGYHQKNFIISFTSYELNTLSTYNRHLQERYMHVFYFNVRGEEFYTDSVRDDYSIVMYMLKSITLSTYTYDYGKNLTMMYCTMEHHLLDQPYLCCLYIVCLC